MAKLQTRLFPLFFAVMTLITLGMLFYSSMEGWNYIDSFYFTIMTLTTVGYGDFSPTTDASKLFTAVYVLFGVYLMFYTLMFFTRYYVERRRPNIKKAVTQTLARMVHTKKDKQVVIKVEEESGKK